MDQTILAVAAAAARQAADRLLAEGITQVQWLEKASFSVSAGL